MNIGYVQVTRECNQSCVFCSNPPSAQQKSLAELKEQIDILVSKQYQGIIFTGGEPTLYPHLVELVSHASSFGILCILISNGQKLSNKDYLKTLIKAGLNQINLSVYSYKSEVHDTLTGNPGALQTLHKTLENLFEYPQIAVHLNTVLNSVSIAHVHETLLHFLENYSFIRHVVVNNMDPLFNRVQENPYVIPSLEAIELAAFRIGSLLNKLGCTFRMERVPLCLMTEYSAHSTETRKIVKQESRTVFFLDRRDKIEQNKWEYHKEPGCSECYLNPICAGLYAAERPEYDKNLLAPVFIKPELIQQTIMGT